VILAGDVRVRPPGVHEVEILLSVASLRAHPVDYAAAASIHIDDRSRPKSGFAGFVDRVEVGNDVIRITLISGLAQAKERRLGGVECRGIRPLEIAWSLMRMAGVDEDRIHIEGFQKGTEETFRVAVPFRALMLEPDLTVTIGDVLLTGSSQVQEWANSYTYPELVEQYRSGPAWMYTDVVARTAVDAESEGMRRIGRAEEWLMLRMRYSYSFAPNGSPFAYARDYQRADYGVAGPVLVGGQVTGRGWIRNRHNPIERPTVQFDETQAGQLPTLPTVVPPAVREAIGFWTQARVAQNPLDAVVLLTTAMEFYTAGAKTTKTFTRRDRRGVKRLVNGHLTDSEDRCLREAFAAAGEELSEELRARLDQTVERVLNELNEPSFLMRLSAAVQEDDVPMSDAEWETLSGVREMRNDLVHGKHVPQPDPAVLRLALALVNRMIMYRIARLAAGA
jgi:hypothetical protein